MTVVTFWETITASHVCRYSFVAIWYEFIVVKGKTTISAFPKVV